MITIHFAQAVRITIQIVLVFLLPAFALAQQTAPAASAVTAPKAAAAEIAEKNPFTAHSRFTYGFVKQMLVLSAEKMPEESYGFKPAESVRTFGQIIGHAADAQFGMCSAAMGWKNPATTSIEKTTSAKADLIAALKESFAYCEKAYSELTDANATEIASLRGNKMPRLGVMNANQFHAIEHYGNLITYLRMNNIVPPSSEPGFGRPPVPKK